MKTFYIETFGCQMNVHDSEKVIGTLLSEGYSQVAQPEAADLILYNTCSIRDKAEQKVFHRLADLHEAAGERIPAFKGWVTSDLHATKVSRFLIFISARCRWFTNTGPRSP